MLITSFVITYTSLGLGNSDTDFAKSRVELSLVNLLVSIKGVEVTESSGESTDSFSTSSSDLGSDLVEDYRCTRSVSQLTVTRPHNTV